MNRLQFETSPYLLQHRHNPVDWFAWKPEAFEKARAENRPILVSIGYSTCHWCHVMERESFEDEATARLMNDHFVCIKVDREERPDLDQIYMEACQILTGGGGWPLNCFLTPDGRPFFAGTYWPPRPAYNRPAWQQVLLHIYKVWSEKQATAEQQADQLTAAIHRNDGIFLKNNPRSGQPHPQPLPQEEGRKIGGVVPPLHLGEGLGVGFSALENIFYKMRDQFDRADGGFGGAPKFPSTMAISFLMGWHFHTQNAEALEHALFSLEKMIGGGIYDQLGGGFARYATDREWLVPHFEKMLYDNALLLVVLADAFKITRRPIFEETIHETIGWLFREMTAPAGCFYSAQDADSEGVEGKFFVWQKAEIEATIGEEAALFCDFYDVSENGNWEESNILNRPQSFAEFSKTAGIDEIQLKSRLAASRQKLLAIRSQRIWPGLDDKIIAGWNGLMISGLCRAFEATGSKSCREAARRALDYIFEKRAVAEMPHLLNSPNSPAAFLEDFACLAAACLDFYEISFEIGWLKKAEAIVDHVHAHFFDDESGLFFFASDQQTDLLMRRRDFYDNATPSGNSTMVMNLQRLGLLVGRTDFSEMADRMLDSMRETVENYPMSFERWAAALMNRHFSMKEVTVVGQEAFATAEQIGQIFLPGRILAASETGNEELPLFEGRATDGQASIFLCENQACRQPVRTVDEFKKMVLP